MRDVLRAEAKVQTVEITRIEAALRSDAKFHAADINGTLQRIENKLDHYAETQATHSERIDKLERGKREDRP